MVNLFDIDSSARPAVTVEGLSGVREQLLRSEREGDRVVECQMEPGSAWHTALSRSAGLLVLKGAVAVTNGSESWLAESQDYCGLEPSFIDLRAEQPAVVLVVEGPGIGQRSRSLAESDQWTRVGDDMDFLALGENPTRTELAERLTAAVRLDPGGSVPIHGHATAHIFVFLDGAVEDVIIHPNGNREVRQRVAGDFVVYPFPIEHCLRSDTGCRIFFIHEPVIYGRSDRH